MSASLSIVFAGTPAFAVPALEALCQSHHRVRAVYTQPDRPAGRGQQLTMSPVKQVALAHALPVEQPVTLREAEALSQLRAWQADVMVVVAYGLLLPADALAAPRLGCLNIHASLLPRWRGAAPIQRAIQAGDTETGVCIMQMEQGLDTGPVLLERRIPIEPQDTAQSLHDRLAQLGAAALLEALAGVADGSLRAQSQADAVTYAAKLTKDEARIDWGQSAVTIDRQVRAFNPWPVAETRYRGQQLRVWEAAPLATQSDAAPGTVVAIHRDGIDVATGAGTLRLLRVQAAGRKAVAAAEFARGQALVGAVLGA